MQQSQTFLLLHNVKTCSLRGSASNYSFNILENDQGSYRGSASHVMVRIIAGKLHAETGHMCSCIVGLKCPDQKPNSLMPPLRFMESVLRKAGKVVLGFEF